MTTTTHPLAQDYLARLRDAAQDLPAADRDELLAELQSHLEAGLPADASDADVRNLLDRLGRPEDIVAAAYEESGAELGWQQRAASHLRDDWGVVEVLAVLCLTLGWLVAPIFAPIVGVVLAWTSRRWSLLTKAILTVVVVIVVAAAAGGLLAYSGSGGVGSDSPAVPVQSPATSTS